MNKYKIFGQPCYNFDPHDDPSWKCPRCGKNKLYCFNCDMCHHENGWDNCHEKAIEYKND